MLVFLKIFTVIKEAQYILISTGALHKQKKNENGLRISPSQGGRGSCDKGPKRRQIRVRTHRTKHVSQEAGSLDILQHGREGAQPQGWRF